MDNDLKYKFKAGDVVQLRTGGCLMTVEFTLTQYDDSVACVWFDDGGELKRSRFTPESLRRVTIET